MHLDNQSNDYVRVIRDVYDKIPKTVFAAIAMSYCSCGGDHLDTAQARLIEEWQILHDNGIVPQSPSKYLGKHRA